MNYLSLLTFLSLLATVPAWISQSPTRKFSALEMSTSREEFLKSLSVAVVGSLIVPQKVLAEGEQEGAAEAAAVVEKPVPVEKPPVEKTLENGVKVKVLKTGGGAKPVIGELIGIRFKAFAGANKIDDIFDTPEPYYTRVGSGGLIKGVEATLPLMELGDRWELTIPGKLAFGPKGRPASAGKPRIPGDATIVFTVEVVAIPGREQELIELIGDV